MDKKYNPNGLILWEGPSAVNGEPVVVIVTGLKRKSQNAKTGADMLQVFYLLQDTPPVDAVRNGSDVAICGDCKHRPHLGGKCYVKTWRAPRAVWAAYHAGRYARWDGDPAPFMGRRIRFGSYGDPACAPDECNARLDPIRAVVSGISAYTHQWDSPLGEHLRSWVMASTDNVAEYLRAKAAGWRSFRVRQANEPVEAGERVCPAAKEAPTSLTCAQCLQCNGLGVAAKRPDRVIVHH